MSISFFVIVCSIVCELLKQIQWYLFQNSVVLNTRQKRTLTHFPIIGMLISLWSTLFHCDVTLSRMVFSLTQNCKFGNFKLKKNGLNCKIWFYSFNIKFIHMINVTEIYTSIQMYLSILFVMRTVLECCIMSFVDGQII